MQCVGIFMEAYSQNKLFNTQLALSQGFTMIKNNEHVDDPEKLRRLVEIGLRRCHPMIEIGFVDLYSEMEIDLKEVKELGEYSLLIKAEAPIFSGRIQ